MNDIGPRNRNEREGLRAPDEKRSGEDHQERARKRVAEIRALHGDDDASEIFVDKWYAAAPPDWTYEWKTHSVFNKEYPQYFSSMLRSGWSAVPAARHRDLVYPGYENESIIIDGLILMERPKELTDRVRKRELAKAIEQVRSSEAKLTEAPPNTGPRGTAAFTRPIIASHVGPVIPE